MRSCQQTVPKSKGGQVNSHKKGVAPCVLGHLTKNRPRQPLHIGVFKFPNGRGNRKNKQNQGGKPTRGRRYAAGEEKLSAGFTVYHKHTRRGAGHLGRSNQERRQPTNPIAQKAKRKG